MSNTLTLFDTAPTPPTAAPVCNYLKWDDGDTEPHVVNKKHSIASWWRSSVCCTDFDCRGRLTFAIMWLGRDTGGYQTIRICNLCAMNTPELPIIHREEAKKSEVAK